VVCREEIASVDILISTGSKAMQLNWSPQRLPESPSACRRSVWVEQKGWCQCKARIARCEAAQGSRPPAGGPAWRPQMRAW
jgi:hypothetical protein